MKVDRFLKILQHPHDIIPEDVTDLQKLLQSYPYFQIAYSLLAKAAYHLDRTTAEPAIQRAAVYATNRNHLKALLDNKPPFSASESRNTHACAEEKGEQTTAKNLVSGCIKAIKQKNRNLSTNEKCTAQHHIIQGFIKKEVRFRPPASREIPDEASYLDLTQKSTTFHSQLATETLAQVLLQQGNLSRALEVYEQLLLKFPKKRTYFTALIKKLQKQC